MNYLADKSYIAIKEETTNGVAVIPTVFLPLESADLATVLNNAPDRRMQGNDWEASEVNQGERTHEGTIKLWADADTLGHILNMTMVKGSTTGNGSDGYTHPFTPGDPSSYTIEIPRGDYAQRFFGVKADTLRLLSEEAKLKAELTVKAMGQVSAFTLGAGVTGGAGAVISLSQVYDLEPTRGLVAGDVIVVGAGTGTEETLTILSINANGIGITFSANVANNHTAGDMCYLKAQTPSLSSLQRPLYFGDVRVGFAATGADAITAAATKSTATPVQEFEVEYMNNLFAVPNTNYRDPAKIMPQQKSARLTIKQLFSTPDQHVRWLEMVKRGISLLMRGKMINVATPTHNQLSWTLHNAKLLTNKEPLNVGEYIMDEQEFAALYDAGDAKALTVTLVNLTSTY